MHAPGERERARLQKGVWWQLRNSSRLKERTVWEVRKRRERMKGARGFIGEREGTRFKIGSKEGEEKNKRKWAAQKKRSKQTRCQGLIQ